MINEKWDEWYVAGLSDFVAIPNLSPEYDPDFKTNGLIEKAIDHVDSCVQKLGIEGLTRQIFRVNQNKSNPLICYAIEATQGASGNVMLYGHLDKQPYEEAWAEGLHPTTPTIKDGCLYGRGSSDDGYAVFSAMLAIYAGQK